MNTDSSIQEKASKRRDNKPIALVRTILGVSGILLCVSAAGGYWYFNIAPVGNTEGKLQGIKVQSEELSDYLEDPSSCAAEFTTNYMSIDIAENSDKKFDVKLYGENVQPVELKDTDLRIFIPRVPQIARGDEFLTAHSIKQQELNRIDTYFLNILPDGEVVNFSNNCLREGLWEMYLSRREGSDTGKYYHGWFEFPLPLYRRLFKEINGFSLKPYEPSLQHYHRFDGTPVNLQHLRQVVADNEIPLDTIEFHSKDAMVHFGEQQSKAKLIATPNLLSYSDVSDGKRQPVKLMQFDEPGDYEKNKLMKFDYSFLRKPQHVRLRKVRNNRLQSDFNELEIKFDVGTKTVLAKNWPFLRSRDGLKLVLGGWRLDDIPQTSEYPIPASSFARFTFGIGTQVVYTTYPDRLKTLNREASNIYLIMLDKNDKYVDNHTLGLDQVYVTRLTDDSLLIYFVSYERIMLAAHWQIPIQNVRLN